MVFSEVGSFDERRRKCITTPDGFFVPFYFYWLRMSGTENYRSFVYTIFLKIFYDVTYTFKASNEIGHTVLILSQRTGCTKYGNYTHKSRLHFMCHRDEVCKIPSVSTVYYPQDYPWYATHLSHTDSNSNSFPLKEKEKCFQNMKLFHH